MERTAQCHCGALRATVTGEPFRSYVCHCKACQRRTGAIMHSGAYYPKEKVRVEGQSKVYSRSTESGNTINFHFCLHCGTSVFWEGNKYPDRCGIAVGCFADPTFPPPVRSMWEESMHPWLQMPSGIERIELGVGPDGLPMKRPGARGAKI
jgi:hypothetical protein